MALTIWSSLCLGVLSLARTWKWVFPMCCCPSLGPNSYCYKLSLLLFFISDLTKDEFRLFILNIPFFESLYRDAAWMDGQRALPTSSVSAGRRILIPSVSRAASKMSFVCLFFHSLSIKADYSVKRGRLSLEFQSWTGQSEWISEVEYDSNVINTWMLKSLFFFQWFQPLLLTCFLSWLNLLLPLSNLSRYGNKTLLSLLVLFLKKRKQQWWVVR